MTVVRTALTTGVVAAGLLAATVHADAACPVDLAAIHGTLDAAVVADARVNYGLPVVAAWCWSAPEPTDTPFPTIACTVYGTGGLYATATGIAYVNMYVPGHIGVGMVYTPA
jgi:hypothetical protein